MFRLGCILEVRVWPLTTPSWCSTLQESWGQHQGGCSSSALGYLSSACSASWGRDQRAKTQNVEGLQLHFCHLLFTLQYPLQKAKEQWNVVICVRCLAEGWTRETLSKSSCFLPVPLCLSTRYSLFLLIAPVYSLVSDKIYSHYHKQQLWHSASALSTSLVMHRPASVFISRWHL